MSFWRHPAIATHGDGVVLQFARVACALRSLVWVVLFRCDAAIPRDPFHGHVGFTYVAAIHAAVHEFLLGQVHHLPGLDFV